MKVFEDLGTTVDRLWHEVHYDEKSFDVVAARSLAESRIGDVSYSDILDWVRKTRALPRQMNIASTFGEPPVTLHASPRFYVEALFWLDGTTTIHQHSFSGAFQVLAGSSVHTLYDFDFEHRINSHMHVGSLHYRGSEILSAGDVRPISAGRQFIHSLFHMDRPSVTIVLRTYSDPDAHPQFNYFPPSFAVDPFYKEDSLTRHLQCLGTLRRLEPSAYEAALFDSIERADAHTAYILADHALGGTEPGEAFSRILDQLPAIQPEYGPQFHRTFSARARQSELIHLRKQVTHPEHRLFLALMLNVPSREAILDLVARNCSTNAPLELVQKWVAELARIEVKGRPGANAIGVPFDDPVPFVLERLISGDSTPEIVVRLSEEYNEDDVAQFAGAIGTLCERLSDSSLLRPLFSTRHSS